MIRIFTFMFFIACGSVSFSQAFPEIPVRELEKAELVVRYLLSYQQDSLNDQDIRDEEMVLQLGENVSKFYSHDSYLFRKTSREYAAKGLTQKFLGNPDLRPPPGRFRYSIFKNFPLGKMTTADHLPGDHFIYREELNALLWEIKADTTSFQGYPVQKAVTDYGGRAWVAWFTTEIPFRDGPYKFHGLPGLIVKIHDTQNHYVFELLSVEKPRELTTIDFLERNYIETTRTRFFQAKSRRREILINRASEAGSGVETIRILNENARIRNNPLELAVD